MVVQRIPIKKDGKVIAVYLDVEVGGFAIHLLQK